MSGVALAGSLSLADSKDPTEGGSRKKNQAPLEKVQQGRHPIHPMKIRSRSRRLVGTCRLERGS